MEQADIKMIFVPGNAVDAVEDRWRPYLVYELAKLGIGTINVNFPDPDLARRQYWLPYLESLSADENTILVGHSSGALAAMRYAETHQILGSVLIGASASDLDDEKEEASGYFDDPWNWEDIKQNQQWIVQFASTDDLYVPIDEMRNVKDQLDTEYYEYTDRGHFDGMDEFPELLAAVEAKL